MQYRIRFKHSTDPEFVRVIAAGVPGIPKHHVQAVTICTLEDENRRVIGRGYGFCSIQDTFSKEKGRRTALADALDDAFPYINPPDADAARMNALLKRERRAVWDLYFSRNEGRFDPRRKAA